MIAVEITAGLAADPQVVPVDADPCPSPTSCPRMTRQMCRWDGNHLLKLVGQRVTLAWRETCQRCDGRGVRAAWWGRGATEKCPDCTDGQRIVGGWTAEVEAVVPVLHHGDRIPDDCYVFVAVEPRGTVALQRYAGRLNLGPLGQPRRWDRTQISETAADWSPGRYALVLQARTGLVPSEAEVAS